MIVIILHVNFMISQRRKTYHIISFIDSFSYFDKENFKVVSFMYYVDLCCYDMLQPQPVSSRRPLPTPPKVSESAGIPVRRPSYEDKLVENSKSSSTSSSKDESCDLETPRVRVGHVIL